MLPTLLLRRFGLALALAAPLALSPRVGAEPRQAQVAGQFYPADTAELSGLVRKLLDAQPAPATPAKPRILIVPHAGYQFSGPIAARAYRQVVGHAYDGVVVVGFTHRGQFRGASVDASEGYDTPMGRIPVAVETAKSLRSAPGLGYLDNVHALPEHSLEVQVPFLQRALPGVPLIPVLMGGVDPGDAQQLAEALADLSRSGDYLFVFSTDLSHYHPAAAGEAKDHDTVEAILRESGQAVQRLFDHGRLEACGRGPIVVSLLLAAALGYPARELLAYAHSGQTSGDMSRVVGYAAIAMYDPPAESGAGLPPEAGGALVAAARQALERVIGGREPPDAVDLSRFPELSQPRGVFVTLRKQGRLRGCIGRIQTDEPLAASVPKVAVDSALRDSRFPRVEPEELKELDVEVSVLTPPQRLAKIEELVPGRDGVILEHRGRSGVFLPQVWIETAWTRLEFLRELASQKAGLPPDAWKDAELYTFRDQIFSESP
jgi:AmmeMemoRadiSam system protein B/AmmeMemoRadiSam system protein A